jgi:hypothetical protein
MFYIFKQHPSTGRVEIYEDIETQGYAEMLLADLKEDYSHCLIQMAELSDDGEAQDHATKLQATYNVGAKQQGSLSL